MAQHALIKALSNRRKLIADSNTRAIVTTGLTYPGVYLDILGTEPVVVAVTVVATPGQPTVARIDDMGTLARRTRTLTRAYGLTPLSSKVRRVIARQAHLDAGTIGLADSISPADELAITCPAMSDHIAEAIDRLAATLVAAEAATMGIETAMASPTSDTL